MQKQQSDDICVLILSEQIAAIQEKTQNLRILCPWQKRILHNYHNHFQKKYVIQKRKGNLRRIRTINKLL